MQNNRLCQMDKRSGNAFTILATMTIASAIVCCFGPIIPELLLISAATTMLCSGIGVMATMLLKLQIAMEQLNNI